jgi:ABC-type antimicrobial peptide transport system permease subunit
VAGVTIGLPASIWLASILRAFVSGVATLEPLALAVPIAIISTVGLAAGYVPARRAVKVDPVVALRYE